MKGRKGWGYEVYRKREEVGLMYCFVVLGLFMWIMSTSKFMDV